MQRHTITYAVDPDGLVVSRLGNEYAWPVLDWDAMTPDNNFRPKYHLEKFLAVSLFLTFTLRQTRRVPTAIKNLHREFWGMPPLKEKNP